MWEKVPHHVAYRASRELLTALLADRPEAADVPVPACPGWTVGDVLVHLLSVNRRVVQGTEVELWEIPSERPQGGLRALLDDWAALDEGTERRLTEPYQLQHSVLIMDVFSHENDIRSALGEPVPADHPAYPLALDLLVLGFGREVRTLGLPALRLEAPGATWVAGEGEPAGTVRGHRRDLLRSLSGRRTLEQIYALDWTGNAEIWSTAFTWGPFQPPEAVTERSLVE
jgi:uncharacterized protein (TIGR03083 family)